MQKVRVRNLDNIDRFKEVTNNQIIMEQGTNRHLMLVYQQLRTMLLMYRKREKVVSFVEENILVMSVISTKNLLIVKRDY